MAGFELISVEPLTMRRTNRLAEMYVLSPFVWRDRSVWRMLLRAVPRRDDEPRLKMAEIWHGRSADGLHFDMDVAPVIFPGPGLADLDGCEDPTVLHLGKELRVWYTGYNEKQKIGRLMLARGPDVARLAKTDIAIDSTPDFANPKEASVVPRGKGWRVFFEYARGGASLIGRADADDLDGPWSAAADGPIAPRPDNWDSWHLSPGPTLGEKTARPTMFYNGAPQTAHWRIGWVVFDRGFGRVLERCDAPLVSPNGPVSEGATDIAFAASAVEHNGIIRLYFSESDQDLRCAILRRV